MILAVESNVTTEETRPVIFLSQIHGFRGLLSLIVLCFHFNIVFHVVDFGLEMMARAVDGFVVLSGFIICRTIIGNKRINVVKFVLQRITRLTPSYYFALFSMTASIYFVEGQLSSIYDFVCHLLYVHNFFFYYTQSIDGAFWSVGLEMSLYLLYSLVLAVAQRLKVPLMHLLVGSNIAFFLLCVVVRAYSPEFTESYLYNRHLFSRWIQFTAGVYLCLVGGNLLASQKKLVFWAIATLVSIFLICTGRFPFMNNFYWSIVFLMILNIVLTNVTVNRVMSISVLQWFGSISYPMYLIHGTVFYLTTYILGVLPFSSNAKLNPVVFLSIPVVFILAHIVTIFEGKCIRFIRKISSLRESGLQQ